MESSRPWPETGGAGNLGDGGSATIAALNSPQSLTVDSTGNLFIADSGNYCIREITNGTIIRLAGVGYANNSYGGQGPAIYIGLDHPMSVIKDLSGNLLIADQLANRICKVDANGNLTTFAGQSSSGFSGDGGPANSAKLNQPVGLALDNTGDIFFTDSINRRVREIDTNGIITTIAGTGVEGYSGDGIAATNAGIEYAQGITVDNAGNVFFAEICNAANQNAVVRKIDTNGIITTVAGNPAASIVGFSGDGVAATNTTLYKAAGVLIAASGNLYIADSGNNRIRMVDTNGIITTVAGNGFAAPSIGDGGPATNATIKFPTGLAMDNEGNLFIVENGSSRIRKVDTNGIITTIAGNGTGTYTGDSGPATNGRFGLPTGVVVDGFDNLFVADQGYNRVRKIDINNLLSTIAGNGTAGYSGDGGTAINAKLNSPNRAVVDASGNIYVADVNNHRIRKIDTTGHITTIAGNGTSGFFGDGSAAINANLNSPSAVAVDSIGNLFIADQNNYRVRKVDTNGIINTVAGNGNSSTSGDGGSATNAGLSPYGICVDLADNLYIADKNNNRIRKVTTNGIISTVAGTNMVGYSGDGGFAITNRLAAPAGIAVDSEGNLFIADQNNCRIREIGTNGIIATVAGNGTSAFSGDGGAATNAGICLPLDVAVDAAGNLFIADQDNYRIRRVAFSNKPFLTLFDVTTASLGDYRVVITSASGSVTSSVVNLNLQLPPITPDFDVTNRTLNLSWATVSNLTYQLQAATNLANPMWQNVGDPVTAVSNSISVIKSNSVRQEFYRAQLSP